MYGADWCGDCRRSKKVFERLAVAYRWVDCDATPGAIETVVEINGGRKSIPVIVFPDVDVNVAIGGASNAIFFNAGQVCAAGSRLFAHRKIFDKVVEGISGAAGSIRLGPRRSATRWRRAR